MKRILYLLLLVTTLSFGQGQGAINQALAAQINENTARHNAIAENQRPIDEFGQAVELLKDTDNILLNVDGTTFRAELSQVRTYIGSVSNSIVNVEFINNNLVFTAQNDDTITIENVTIEFVQGLQTALDGKQDISPTDGNSYLLLDGSIVQSEIYTPTEKTKLEGIETGANNYVLPSDVVQDANYVHTDNNFTNTLVSKLNTIETGAQVNVNADWDEVNTLVDAFILNKPTNLSDFTNDEGFITNNDVDLSNLVTTNTAQTITGFKTFRSFNLVNSGNNLQFITSVGQPLRIYDNILDNEILSSDNDGVISFLETPMVGGDDIFHVGNLTAGTNTTITEVNGVYSINSLGGGTATSLPTFTARQTIGITSVGNNIPYSIFEGNSSPFSWNSTDTSLDISQDGDYLVSLSWLSFSGNTRVVVGVNNSTPTQATAAFQMFARNIDDNPCHTIRLSLTAGDKLYFRVVSGSVNGRSSTNRFGTLNVVRLQGVKGDQGIQGIPGINGTGAVNSVNSEAGDVVLDADDIDDTSTTNKFATATQLAKLDDIDTSVLVTTNTVQNITEEKTILDADLKFASTGGTAETTIGMDGDVTQIINNGTTAETEVVINTGISRTITNLVENSEPIANEGAASSQITYLPSFEFDDGRIANSFRVSETSSSSIVRYTPIPTVSGDERFIISLVVQMDDNSAPVVTISNSTPSTDFTIRIHNTTIPTGNIKVLRIGSSNSYLVVGMNASLGSNGSITGILKGSGNSSKLFNASFLQVIEVASDFDLDNINTYEEYLVQFPYIQTNGQQESLTFGGVTISAKQNGSVTIDDNEIFTEGNLLEGNGTTFRQENGNTFVDLSSTYSSTILETVDRKIESTQDNVLGSSKILTGGYSLPTTASKFTGTVILNYDVVDQATSGDERILIEVSVDRHGLFSGLTENYAKRTIYIRNSQSFTSMNSDIFESLSFTGTVPEGGDIWSIFVTIRVASEVAGNGVELKANECKLNLIIE